MRERGNYFGDIERVVGEALEAVGYVNGPVSERVLIDLAGHFGFRVERVKQLPRSARSITDQRARIIYIPQRNDLRTRAARSVVLQTLGHFALDHSPPRHFGDYLRQRVASNYFAAAVLAPEGPAVAFLQRAKSMGDLSIEDLKEVFYISYEMAAHRLTNLATRHLGLGVHFLRTDPDGVILKAYENDGMPFPTDADGHLEGMRVTRSWGAHEAWRSPDSFSLHYQYTVTDVGEYWDVTYLETEGPAHAITLGTQASDARHFRGSDTPRHVRARAVDEQASPGLVARWNGVAWPSAAQRSYVLSVLPVAEQPFTPFPGVDVLSVYRFLDEQAGSRAAAAR
jgi:hypothetical protein